MTKTAAIAADEIVVQIPIDKLTPHPRNTHGELGKSHPRIVELMASIAKIGQSEPCLVRSPSMANAQEILSGHLRVQAQRLLGAETVPCIVKDVDDEEALAILLTSNEKEPVDPLLEAEAIQEFLEKKGGNLREVADKLGKTVRYVALRANLRTLSGKVRKLYADGKLSLWTVDMLELLAKLSGDAQDELASDMGWRRLDRLGDLGRLEQAIGDRFHELGCAGWSLDNAELVPSAGPCTTCPKTSLRAPGLFDDGDVDPESKKALKKAVCRDVVCWSAKRAAVVQLAIAEAKKSKQDLVVVKEDRDAVLPKAVKSVERWTVTEVEKGTKGAKPAVFVREGGKVEQGFVETHDERSSRSSPAKDKKPAKEIAPKERLKLSREAIGKRRRAFVVDSIRDRIADMKDPPELTKGGALLGLVASYKLEHPEDLYFYAEPKRRKKVFEACAGSMASFASEVWPRLQDSIAETLKRVRPESLDDEHAAATWLAGLLGIDVSAIVNEAVKEIPDPKWWGKADAAETTKPVVADGACRGCGCTHDKACAGGCSWVEKPAGALKKQPDGRFLALGLCSSCAGAQPKGKKAKKAKKATASAR